MLSVGDFFRTAKILFLAVVLMRIDVSQDFCAVAIAQDRPSSQSAAEDQTYYGELDAGSRLFRFVLTVAKTLGEDSKVSAKLKSLDEGDAVFTLDEVVFDDQRAAFQLKSTSANFEGRVEDGGKTLRGQWKQRGIILDLMFRKRDPQKVDSPSEVWSGQLKTGLQKLEVQFRGFQDTNGSKRFFFDSLTQKTGGYKSELSIEGSTVQIAIPALKAKFKGEINDSSNEIVGKWNQGIPIDLKLTKSLQAKSAADVAVQRPQTPKAPFPYDVTDVVFTNQVDNIELAGTLTVPKGKTNCPVAILISGSGPQDRDETIMDHKPFWVLADHLSRNGIAVFRFDDRGIGQSKGKFDTATTLDFANDVKAAVAYVRSRNEIDPQSIGLIGHSEGGIIAPMVAADDPKIAWIVLMAGTGVNGEEVMYSQGRLIIQAEGGSEVEMQRQLAIQKRCFEALGKSNGRPISQEDKDAIINLIIGDLESGQNNANTKSVSDDKKKALIQLVQANLNAMQLPWFRFFAAHEPGPVLERVLCPVLAINGEKDVQVDPKLNLAHIENSLKKAGNKHVTIKNLPDLNHMFQTCKTGAMSEYQSIEETMSPIALKTISDWIHGQ